ncbi:MAG: lipoate--protein ligase family protein [Armatimonadetes bacterium]|nr:lipoate--protein ligase family protein [Armatimonadota bacterium]
MLRLYSWQPAAVSLGFGQRSAEIDREGCRRHGIDVTRRITGGRAVLHQAELTYAVVVEAERLRVGKSVARAYQLLTAPLIAALRAVGVEASCSPRTGPLTDRDPACFATAIGGDLSVGGRKLVGSAQCHKFGGILQHGALPLRIDESLLTACLKRPPGATRQWTCLEELRVELTAELFAAPLAEAYTELLGGRPEIGQPTAAERQAMAALAPKYAGEEWVYRL